MRFTYFRSEPRRLHARSPRSSASRGVSEPSALQGPVRNRNRDRDDERGRSLADREPASRWFSSPTKRVASRSTRPEMFPGPGRQPGHPAHPRGVAASARLAPAKDEDSSPRTPLSRLVQLLDRLSALPSRRSSDRRSGGPFWRLTRSRVPSWQVRGPQHAAGRGDKGSASWTSRDILAPRCSIPAVAIARLASVGAPARCPKRSCCTGPPYARLPAEAGVTRGLPVRLCEAWQLG